MLRKLSRIPLALTLIILIFRWLRSLRKLGYETQEALDRMKEVMQWAEGIDEEVGGRVGAQKALATAHLDIHRAKHETPRSA